jgi:ABC-type transporter Mla subunit MlaD
MAVQDLTPQLRTRLSRLEKVVGWFVTLATALLLAGLAYYIYNMAERKGWFKTKAPYFTYLESGTGVRAGDPVRLMGFDAGMVTHVTAEKPDSGENVYVEFELIEPYYGYVWDDSVIKVKSAGFLGARYLEVTKGGTRLTNDLHATYREENKKLTGIWVDKEGVYASWQRGDKPYWLPAEEPPDLSSQLDQTVQMLKISLTNILQLTNALTKALTNAAEVTENLNDVLRDAKPIVRNAAEITSNLKDPQGSLGAWLFPVAMNYQLTRLLTNANSTMVNADATVTNANTNLVTVFSNITATLVNLANMTSNLNMQVQRNDTMLTSISKLVVDSDTLVQGLKRHWLLRSAFKDDPATKVKTQKQTKPKPVNPKGSGR